MKFIAEIDIMPLKALLDPQGKAVNARLSTMGLGEISSVRIGKHMCLELEAKSQDQAKEQVELACKNLLHNPIMESFEYTILETK